MRESLRFLRDAVGKEKRSILLLSCLSVLQSALSLGIAMSLRELVDHAVKAETGEIRACSLIFLLCVFGQIVVYYMLRWLTGKTGTRMENLLKGRLTESFLSGEYAWVSGISSGEWQECLTSDARIVAMGIAETVPECFGMLVRFTGTVILMFSYTPRYALVLIPVSVLFFFVYFPFRKRIEGYHHSVQKADGQYRSLVTDELESLLSIKAFSREKTMRQRTEEKAGSLRQEILTRTRFTASCGTVMFAAMRAVYAGAVIYGAFGMARGTLSYGTFAAVTKLVTGIRGTLTGITGFFPESVRILTSTERIRTMCSCSAKTEEPLGEEEINRFYKTEFSGIETENLSFSYEEGQSIFSGLSFSVKKGEFIALTGASGSGKTTLCKLLLSLLPPVSGQILLQSADGKVPLTAKYRGLFAFVPQRNRFISGTVREILSFGDEARMQESEAMMKALKEACADDFPESLDSPIGQDGAGFSEGQLQRLSIARALFSGHPVLLLDEATSALDRETEEKLLQNLRNMKEKTVIIVTHRKEVISVCDREINLDKI